MSRRRRGRLGLGRRVQLLDEGLHFHGVGVSFLNGLQARLGQIEGLENDVDDSRCHAQVFVAGLAHEAFRVLAEIYQSLEAEEAGSSLDRVEAAENPVDQLGVIRGFLEFDKILIESSEEIVGLADEVRGNFF